MMQSFKRFTAGFLSILITLINSTTFATTGEITPEVSVMKQVTESQGIVASTESVNDTTTGALEIPRLTPVTSSGIQIPTESFASFTWTWNVLSGSLLKRVENQDPGKYYVWTFSYNGLQYGNSYYKDITFPQDILEKNNIQITNTPPVTSNKAKSTSTQSITSSKVKSMTTLAAPVSWILAEWMLNGNTDDTSGNAYHATASNIIWGDDGTSMNRLTAKFNGSSSYIISPSVSIPVNYSYSFWFYPNQWKIARLLEQSWDQVGTFSSATISTTNWASIFDFRFSDWSQSSLQYTFPSLNTWYHVVWKYDGSTLRLYVNGTSVSSLVVNKTAKPNTLQFWLGSINPAYRFNGNIKLARLYNKALSDSEVTSLYQEWFPPPSDPATNTPIIASYTPAALSIYAGSTHNILLNNDTIANTFLNQLQKDRAAEKNKTIDKADPVNLETGEFTYENTFMSIPGKKLPFDLTLNYRNQLGYDGPVGNNFDHSSNIFLTENAGSVNFFNGKLGIFGFSASGSSFTYNQGLKANLIKNPTTSLYSLVFDNGTVYNFGSNLKISKLTDRSGNSLNYAYNTNKQLTTVTDTLGRNIVFTYNAVSRLDKVTDFNNRSVEFAYYASWDVGGSANDLKSVTLRSGASTKVISFTYTGSHNIATLVDSKGQTYVSNIYNTDDRVTSQVYGSGTTSYVYTLNGSSVATNTVTNPNGVQTRYTFDANGNTTKREIFDTTGTGSTIYTSQFDANARLMKSIFPRWNGVTYKYDARWNVIEVREKTDANSADTSNDLITTTTYDGLYDQPISTTSPSGLVTVFTLNGSGSIISQSATGIINPDGSTYGMTTTFQYDTNGQLIKKTDPEGISTAYAYGSGQIQSITLGTGALTSQTLLSFDAYGNILTSTDPENNIQLFAYTPFNLTASGKTAEGIETRYTYDLANNKTKEEKYTSTGWIVGTITYEYDILDRITKKVESIDSVNTKTTLYTYDLNGNISTIKEGSGALVKYKYSELNRLIETRQILDPADTTKDIVSTKVYDRNGNVVSVTDGLGYTTTFTYNLFDQLIKKTDPIGTYTSSVYDKSGNILEVSTSSSTWVLLTKNSATYDQLGHPLSSTAFDLTNTPAVNAVTTTKYNRNGNPLEVIDPRGNKTTTTYDALGRVLSVTDALWNKSLTTYDKRSLTLSKSIVQNNGTGSITTTSAYDKDGRLSIETNNLGKTKTYTYNALGSVVSFKDEANSITTYERNYFGKPTKETKTLADGSTVITQYTFDERGNLTSITDPKNNTTTYQYDNINRNTKVIYPDTKTLVYSYDKNSNIITQTDPNGTLVNSIYDNRNLLTSKTITTGTGVVGITSETYTYDPLGRIISGNDTNLNKLTFTYDSQSRLVSESNSGVTVGYGYDANNNLSKLIYPDLKEQTYTYDPLSRVTSIAYSGSSLATYTYTGVLNTGITYTNNQSISQTFDGLLRLQSLNTGVNSYTYTYDDLGNITSDTQKTYTYDKLSRLTQSSNTASWNILESFTYDKAGNRTNDTVNQYTSNTLNQYSTLSGATATTLVYDNNGNLISNGRYTFQYDYKNRLLKVNSGSTIITEFTYDFLGRRILKKTQSDTTKYVYSNDNILTETRTTGTQTFRKTYFNGLGTDNLIAYDNEEVNLSPGDREELGFCNTNVLSATGSFIKYGYQTIVDRCNTLSNSGSIIVTNRYFFHKNHLGSVVGLTNNTWVLVAEYQYDTFGNTYQRTTSTGSFTKIDPSTSFPYDNTRLFTSREYDKEIWLYYLRARYYDPNTGRFISRDPIGQNDQVNLYTYVGNNPMGFVDLMGKEKMAIVKIFENASRDFISTRDALDTPFINNDYEADLNAYYLLLETSVIGWKNTDSVFGKYDLAYWARGWLERDLRRDPNNKYNVIVDWSSINVGEIANVLAAVNAYRLGFSQEHLEARALDSVIMGLWNWVEGEAADRVLYSYGFELWKLESEWKLTNQILFDTLKNASKARSQYLN